MSRYFKLPFSKQPFIKCYSYNAIPLAIVQGNTKWEQFVPWICSKVCNCVFMENVPWEEFALCTKDPSCKDDGILKYTEFIVYQETIKFMKLNILDIYKLILRNGYYLRICYSSKFIPTEQACANPKLLTDTILCGYDDDYQKVFLVNYYLNGLFESYEMSYEDYYNAMLCYPEDKITYQVILCIPKLDHVTKIDNTIAEFSDYVLSTSSREPLNQGRTYGMASMKKLKEYFTNPESPYMDFRYLRALVEQKELLLMCVGCLKDQGVITNDYGLELVAICDTVKRIQKLCNDTKNGCTSDSKKQIGHLFDCIIEQENRCLPAILKSIGGKQ